MVDDGRLIYSELMDDTMVLITPVNDRFKKIEGDTIEFKDILDERFILREGSSATRQVFESAISPGGYKLSRLNIFCQASGMDAVLQLVRDGLGVSIVSEGAAREYIDFGMVKKFYIKDLYLNRKIYMVKYNRRTLSPAAKMFENHARELRIER
jgi:DNA-binding transcriptional LysR family regulator